MGEFHSSVAVAASPVRCWRNQPPTAFPREGCRGLLWRDSQVPPSQTSTTCDGRPSATNFCQTRRDEGAVFETRLGGLFFFRLPSFAVCSALHSENTPVRRKAAPQLQESVKANFFPVLNPRPRASWGFVSRLRGFSSAAVLSREGGTWPRPWGSLLRRHSPLRATHTFLRFGDDLARERRKTSAEESPERPGSPRRRSA